MKMDFAKFCNCINISNSQRIIDTLSSFGDDKATGNRSAGSRASTLAAQYLCEEFKRVGLKNINVDKFSSSGWTYKGANIIYKDENGAEKQIILGGYATSLEANNLSVKIVNGNKGRISDYEALGDVTGKLVLIKFDIWEDFWVTYPTYQAYLKGAKGVLVVTKYPVEYKNNLISQVVAVPAYAPAFAISERHYNILKNLINISEQKEITVRLNAHSYVEPIKTSYNIWGEIRGKSDEVIYLIAHYDGYYHSYFDDACGVSEVLGIAKAVIDSGYKPNKTIRVVAHGAEEWGLENSDYSWSRGAYEQITHIHPEWAEKAFALINIDGNFPVAYERNFEIHVSSELLGFVKRSIRPILYKGEYNFDIISSNSINSEEFPYERAGVPCITARDNMKTSIYFRNIYHSSMDSKVFKFDYGTYKLIHELYGKILFDLDKMPIRPMNFYQHFLEIKESLDYQLVGKSLVRALKMTSFYSYKISSRIEKLNNKSSSLAYKKYHINDCKELNKKLFKLYKKIVGSFIRLNWEGDVVFPHENYQKNIRLIINAIKALNNRTMSLEDIVDQYIKPIDFNKYVYDFDRKTYEFFSNRITHGNRDTFGYGLVEKENEDLYETAISLREKSNEKNPDLRKEISALQMALKRQTIYLHEIYNKELYSINELVEEMKRMLYTK